MNRETLRVARKVHQAWINAIESMKRMNQASIVRPQIPDQIFTLDRDVPADVIKFEIQPVVFRVPERANDKAANLFIVISGWLSFEATGRREECIKTRDFGTKVGYFRRKGDQLEHIYGAHYDMDVAGKGHPVFHAQVGSQMEIGESIETQFRIDDVRVDYLAKVSSSIRTPTAQMDVFSVFAQICADHLMREDSAKEVERAFERTRSVCGFFVGAAHRFAFLQEREVIECYRSLHWYERDENGRDARGRGR